MSDPIDRRFPERLMGKEGALERAYRQGLSTAALVERFGVSKSTIQAALVALGLREGKRRDVRV